MHFVIASVCHASQSPWPCDAHVGESRAGKYDTLQEGTILEGTLQEVPFWRVAYPSGGNPSGGYPPGEYPTLDDTLQEGTILEGTLWPGPLGLLRTGGAPGKKIKQHKKGGELKLSSGRPELNGATPQNKEND